MARQTKSLIVALGIAGISLLLTGCTSKTEQDTSIPWSRPASWEGGVPGMGGMGSPGGGR